MRALARLVVLCVVAAGFSADAFAQCGAIPIVSPSGSNVPVNGAGTVSLKWQAVSGATSYDVYFGTPGQACNANSPHGTVSAPTTDWSPPSNEISRGATYEWRVKANGVACPTPPTSSCTTFTTAACPAVAPTLSAPANNTQVSFGTVTLQWSTVANATGYEIYVGVDGGALASIGTTTASQKTIVVGAGRTIRWYVAALSGQCPAVAAQTFTFTTTCPTGAPSLRSPDSGAQFAIGTAIAFSWTALAGATSYDLQASVAGDNSFETVAENITATSFTKAVPQGNWNWRVRANFDGDCPPAYSTTRSFSVAPACDNHAPELLEPNDHATAKSPVTFKWTGVGAKDYLLYAQKSGAAEPVLLTKTTRTDFSATLDAGVYEWAVVAEYENCPAMSSARRTLTIEAPQEECGDARIELKTPAENASTTSPVRLSWSGISGSAIVYRVWAAADGGSAVILTRTTATEATLSLPAGRITWYVDAPRLTCPTAISSEGHFTVAKATNCAANVAPALVSPVGTELAPAHATSPVTLTWNAAANAIGYRVWLAEKNAAFEDVTLTRDTHLQLDVEPTTYRWFVQALFEGCDPTASAIAFFAVDATTARCPTDAPAILQPASNASVSSPVTISWTAVAAAEKYRLFASRNGEAPLLIGATSETSLERDLPPGQYVITVEATFDECPSTTSERRAFTVVAAQNCSTAATVPVAPSNGATDLASPVTFNWNPVPGAVKYVLFAQANDGAPTAVEATDDTTVTHAVPPGRITWWIVTFFSGCEPTESAHFSFTVERPQSECDNARPILLLPSDEAPAVVAPVHFNWTGVPNATGYNIWVAQGSPAFGIVASTANTEATVDLGPGTYVWFVQATFANCRPTESALGEFRVRAPVACARPEKPQAQVIGQAQSGTSYRVRWTAVPNIAFYELQEATAADFSDAVTFTTASTSRLMTHEATHVVQQRYRVRGVSNCSNVADGTERGPYSDVVGVFIIPLKTNNASAEIGATNTVVQTLFLPGGTATAFSATADKPWITITPSSGPLPAAGITLTITANAKILDLGTNTATILVNYTAPAAHGASTNGTTTNGTTTSIVPVSVSLVTPVTPTGSSSPPPDSLIFPVVGHAAGANDSLFESDIRVTNLTAQPMKYQLKFTPSGTDGTVTGSASSVQIEPNQTLALDDIVSSLFGTGTIGSATGTLEVRPLTTSTSPSTSGSLFSSIVSGLKPLSTAASSRTYNFTPTGTFGQYIPAVRFDEFVGKALSGASPVLSLQQVAQSAAYRANFGFAEGAGQAADLRVRVYDTHNALLATIPVQLQAGEHKQINGMLSANGVNDLANGRVEVEVVGGTGKVTAYVSEVDNLTNDPLLVSAALKGDTTSTRYVVPGVAYINSDFAFWVTDLRIYNAGTAATPATLTFYPQGSPGAAVPAL